MRMLQCIQKKIISFCPQKIEKNTLKSCSEKLKSTFFSPYYCQHSPNGPNNSCSKMWPIDQLYIELGLKLLIAPSKLKKCTCSNHSRQV